MASAARPTFYNMACEGERDAGNGGYDIPGVVSLLSLSPVAETLSLK